jgi:hypothetical protein
MDQIRRKRRVLIAVLMAIVGSTVAVSVAAAAIALERDEGVRTFTARFEARAIGNPNIIPCPDLEAEGVKFEAGYEGTLTTGDGEEFVLRLPLEMMVGQDGRLGSAEGDWQLVAPDDGNVVASGELVAVFTGGELHGMLIGIGNPNLIGNPDLRLVGNFSASLSDGGESLSGAIGNPDLAPNPAVLVPSEIRC